VRRGDDGGPRLHELVEDRRQGFPAPPVLAERRLVEEEDAWSPG
jgi:hypothetical protein